MQIDAYLKRIGYQGSREPSAETLKQLHRAHILSVPFENLDIPLGRSIDLSLSSFYEKVVRRRRGGFCYELNGLFGWLLEQLGFRIKILSARVFNDNQAGPEFDHLLVLVDMKARMIADVGFGDLFLEPLHLDVEEEAIQHGSAYRVLAQGSERVLQRKRESNWVPQYIFSLTPRRLTDFGAMCKYQQTAPESVFTRKTVCSRATSNGRITLANRCLIVTDGDRREEREVASAEAYLELLQIHFKIDIGGKASIERLMNFGKS